MRQAVSVGLLLAAVVATPTMAQHYDLYYVLPAEKGSTGVDVGIATADIGSVGDISDLNVLEQALIVRQPRVRRHEDDGDGVRPLSEQLAAGNPAGRVPSRRDRPEPADRAHQGFGR